MIYSRIKALCKAKNINIHKLEMECGIGNGVIARWQNSSPRIENVKKVADYFGVSLEFLLKE